ncbi:hypothetical protein [Enemella evansiae]|uniref:hypothetical protein n=1 Tax=Enemella evansiae TaxID=2016499 RepID=UPI00117D49CB|nr:hypothetical protein [Enemella evansiae]
MPEPPRSERCRFAGFAVLVGNQGRLLFRRGGAWLRLAGSLSRRCQFRGAAASFAAFLVAAGAAEFLAFAGLVRGVFGFGLVAGKLLLSRGERVADQLLDST